MIELTVQRMDCARIPTRYGEFQLCLYTNNVDEKEHLALVKGEPAGQDEVLVRLHSECFTGDVLGSRRCDCGEQLEQAMEAIAKVGTGVIVYLRQEGRGIGLLDKLRAYNLQDQGYDTVEANLALGHQADERDYTGAVRILEDLGVQTVRLLTNNPGKIQNLEKHGISVIERVPLQTTTYADNAEYLVTKAVRMNHLLDLAEIPVALLKTNGNGNGKNGRH
jgi:GTP cyclohydrolase II